jgi:hypothetical protein
MMYRVGITIHNCFEVEANNQEEAELIVSSYSNEKILEDCDFNYTYVEELEA